jgi:hypothetical protein
MDPVFALSLTGELEKIGAVAGLAAIPALAVLALLFFSHARELKRLREWAGRAPERTQELQERAAEQAAVARTVQPQKRVTAQPIPAQKAGAPATPAGAPATPAPAGAPATAAAQRPAAAPAGAAGATPAGGATEPPAKPGAQPAAAPGGLQAAPPPGAPAPATPAAAPPPPGETAAPKGPAPATPAAAPAAAQATSAPAAPAAPPAQRAPDRDTGDAGTRVAPSPAGAPTPGPGPPPAAPQPPRPAPLRAPSPSATIPPRAPTARQQTAAEEPPRRRLRDRISGRVVAIAAVVAALAAVGAVVVFATGGEDESGQPAENRVVPPQTGNGAAGGAGPLSRGETTVAVLNGTTVPGLAAQVSDELSRGGFRRGSVTNAADQQRPSTTVAYGAGHKRSAEEVAKLLKVPSVSPIDSGTQAIAGGDAAVVVTVGNDRTQ